MKKEKFVYPIPSRLKKELKIPMQTEIYRKFDCIFYNLCLDQASTRRWQSFSCVNCKSYYSDKEATKTKGEEEKCRKLLEKSWKEVKSKKLSLTKPTK